MGTEIVNFRLFMQLSCIQIRTRKVLKDCTQLVCSKLVLRIQGLKLDALKTVGQPAKASCLL